MLNCTVVLLIARMELYILKSVQCEKLMDQIYDMNYLFFGKTVALSSLQSHTHTNCQQHMHVNRLLGRNIDKQRTRLKNMFLFINENRFAEINIHSRIITLKYNVLALLVIKGFHREHASDVTCLCYTTTTIASGKMSHKKNERRK